MTEAIQNGYEDDDLKAVVSNIEDIEKSIKTVMAKAMNEAKQLRNKIKVQKAEARTELNIPSKPLNAMLKLRKKQREMDDICADVPDEYGEMLADMQSALGDFADTELGAAAVGAVERRRTAAEENQDREQEEGGKILDDLVH